MRRVLSVILTLLVVLSVPVFAFADSEITVTGTGEVLIPADTAVVSLGVSATDREVLKAQRRANETIAAIREALIKAGVKEEDINTDYINIYASYDYSEGTEQMKGYNANSTLAIRVTDIEAVGEVIDIAFEAGANTLNGINFSASDTTEAEAKAMKKAVENAKDKAEVLAEASGLKILGIDEIIESGTYSYDRGMMNGFAKATAEDAAAGTVVQAAKLAVNSSVTVKFKAD
jgi:hypothetical protein